MKRISGARARSVPYKRGIVGAVFLSAIHYMTVLAAAAALVSLLLKPSDQGTRLLIICLSVAAFTWLLAFIKRRSTQCPLCKGTPLMNSGAHAHPKATKFFPFNHGVSATLSILVRRKFCCMYCGTDFDLAKKPSRPRRRPH